ncbi:MAG: TIGR00725 family protein [FCB group bacterium]|nr:TIGR00725 family protein [FCB group bacterium]
MGSKETVYIGVIGAGKCAKKLKDQAYAVGVAIAEEKAVLVCGGLKGVMEAAAKGASEAGGRTVGIIPGNERAKANPYCDIVIPTGVGEARNVILVQSADVLISLHGKFGTISEMAFALKMKKPVVSLVTWDVFPEVCHASNPEEAVKKAIELVRDGK